MVLNRRTHLEALPLLPFLSGSTDLGTSQCTVVRRNALSGPAATEVPGDRLIRRLWWLCFAILPYRTSTPTCDLILIAENLHIV